jgi:hypothetical protein
MLIVFFESQGIVHKDFVQGTRLRTGRRRSPWFVIRREQEKFLPIKRSRTALESLRPAIQLAPSGCPTHHSPRIKRPKREAHSLAQPRIRNKSGGSFTSSLPCTFIVYLRKNMLIFLSEFFLCLISTFIRKVIFHHKIRPLFDGAVIQHDFSWAKVWKYVCGRGVNGYKRRESNNVQEIWLCGIFVASDVQVSYTFTRTLPWLYMAHWFKLMLPGKVKEWFYRKVRAVAEKEICTGI